MAFDQSTRNRLQKFVNDARNLLTEEFTRQLQATYGLDPKAGSVAAVDSLTHLDNRQRQVATLLREIVNHYVANSSGKNEKEKTRQALDRLVREQGFTILNRIAALRMAEARGLLIESVAKGYNSKGFQLYKMVAGTSHGETGDAYRNYLYSLFDEFSIDLELLFSRHSAQGQLFPRETALLELLEQINHHEIEHLWAEDETIGWIYQYYNSQEERKKMRKESQAPRTSRELAVRNQFFTPRYVVEFLVDNTLGRLWFDATAGKTNLYDRCQYLLVKPEELEEKRSSTPPTSIRDPRTLKLLDPACGSMHFGLYAFDLFLEIYREAWAWEREHGPGSLDTSAYPEGAMQPLDQVYASESDYLRDVPRLIIEHNIYGVDIDPRAAQIATLALWLRAQRAWHEAGIKAQDRPTIARGHVLAAVAPPAEKDLRERFAAQLDTLDAELFTQTLQLLKGVPEQGVLLQVEQELPRLVRKVFGEHGSLFKEADEQAWQKAEERLRAALTDFAEAGQGSFQNRLYAQDALQVLRVIDLCREVFDVVVMNPPFGEPASSARSYQKNTYPSSNQDIFQCFVDRALSLVSKNGFVGVLSARTGFFMGDSEAWRTNVVMQNQLLLFADLGLGVLDDALVEAAAYVIKHGHEEENTILATRHLSTRDKAASLRASVVAYKTDSSETKDTFALPQRIIEAIPGSVFSYWAPIVFLERFRSDTSFERNAASVRVGLQSGDDPRFYRLAWEVPSDRIGSDQLWRRLSKGGEYSPPFDDIHLVVNWKANGAEMRYCSSARVQNEAFYLQSGATHSVRTASAFAAKVLPEGCVFSSMAQSWFIDDKELLLKSILYFLCRVPQAYVELSVGGGDVSTSGSAARRYTTRVVHSVPASILPSLQYPEFLEDAANIFRVVAFDLAHDETSCLFSGYLSELSSGLKSFGSTYQANRQSLITAALHSSWRLDQAVSKAWNLSIEEVEFIRGEVGLHPCEYEFEAPAELVRELLALPIDKLVARAIEQDGPSRWVTKKSYFVDRKTELICHILKCSPVSIEFAGGTLEASPKLMTARLVSYSVGVAFGRWKKDEVDTTLVENFIHSPFDELPRNPPAAECGTGGQPIFVNDNSDQHSLVAAVERIIKQIMPSNEGSLREEINNALGSDLENYLDREFFVNHIATYSKSRRKAPIYWPLSTLSGAYTLWLYYPALTSQTLFSAVNDFIEPKLRQVRGDLESLRGKGSARSKQEEKQLETATDLVQELADLRDALLAIAPMYSPNHDDGVQITAAPLWQLFRHKPWQKVLNDTWEKLEQGDYDWSHLAMNYWPERVLRKSHQDRSLAIAHDVEDAFWHEVEVPVMRGKKATGKTKFEWQPKDLTDDELNALIQAKIKEMRA